MGLYFYTFLVSLYLKKKSLSWNTQTEFLGNNTTLFLQGQGDKTEARPSTFIPKTKQSCPNISVFDGKSKLIFQLISFSKEYFSNKNAHLSKSSWMESENESNKNANDYTMK